MCCMSHDDDWPAWTVPQVAICAFALPTRDQLMLSGHHLDDDVLSIRYWLLHALEIVWRDACTAGIEMRRSGRVLLGGVERLRQRRALEY